MGGGGFFAFAVLYCFVLFCFVLFSPVILGLDPYLKRGRRGGRCAGTK